MSEQPELKPCPFCGSDQVNLHNDGHLCWVECEDCCAEGPIIVGREIHAVNRWNTRA